mmetsp:Transcript_25504/g.59639  ORF Transcript_25504/g.59639 Transcript_25504/m.59639 type:complete len:292 (+) Transcript_25504:147-1022(+)
MTPMATVLPSVRRENRPKNGSLSNVPSGVIRSNSSITTICMPTVAKAGFLFTMPFLLVVSNSLTTVASSSQVWVWNMAWKPAVKIWLLSGMSISMALQMTFWTDRQGGSVQATNPRWTSSMPHPPPILSRTFSPGRATATDSSLAHTASTLYLLRVGMRVIFIPGRTVPDSTLPMAMVPRSVYRSRMGMRRGAAASRPSISNESSRPISVGTVVLFSPLVWDFFHQSQTEGSTSSLTLAPERPEMGMNLTSRLILKPHDLRKGFSLEVHSSNRSFCQLTVGSSILFTTTTR